MVLWNNLTTAHSKIQVSIGFMWGWLVRSHDHCTDKVFKQNSLENYGSLLVWDAAMPQLKPLMDKNRERQRRYQ